MPNVTYFESYFLFIKMNLSNHHHAQTKVGDPKLRLGRFKEAIAAATVGLARAGNLEPRGLATVASQSLYQCLCRSSIQSNVLDTDLVQLRHIMQCAAKPPHGFRVLACWIASALVSLHALPPLAQSPVGNIQHVATMR